MRQPTPRRSFRIPPSVWIALAVVAALMLIPVVWRLYAAWWDFVFGRTGALYGLLPLVG